MTIFCTGSISDERPIPPSLLSAPQVNSSTRLYNKLTTFKHHINKQQLPPPAHAQNQSNYSDDKQGLTHSTKQCKLVSKQAVVSSACSDVMDLESMASTKPLQVCKLTKPLQVCKL